jgi:hypothetical protein
MPIKVILRRIGVMSLAKIQGVLYALLGLIIGAFASLFSVLGPVLAPGGGSSSGNQFGSLFGVASIALFPILYGAIGFITGLIMGGLYNLLAGVVGGLELETEQIPPESAVPTV